MHYGWLDGTLANLSVSFSELVSYCYSKDAVWDTHLITRTEFPPEWEFRALATRFDVIDTMRVSAAKRDCRWKSNNS